MIFKKKSNLEYFSIISRSKKLDMAGSEKRKLRESIREALLAQWQPENSFANPAKSDFFCNNGSDRRHNMCSTVANSGLR